MPELNFLYSHFPCSLRDCNCGTVPAPNLEKEWSDAKSFNIFSIQFIDFNTSCLYCFSLPLFCCILDLDSRPGRPVLIIIYYY